MQKKLHIISFDIPYPPTYGGVIDVFFKINQTYEFRPDMLAFDLYEDAGLWWVFYQRNPNTLTKPPFDFTTGKEIFLPKLSILKTTLGF